jgi:hypothetical protein
MMFIIIHSCSPPKFVAKMGCWANNQQEMEYALKEQTYWNWHFSHITFT